MQDFPKNSKNITILFYILDSNLLIEIKEELKTIKQYLKEKNIQFKVKYIEIQPENFINFIREFDKKQIKEFNYE